MKRRDIESEAYTKRSNARKLRQNGEQQAAMFLYEDTLRIYKRINDRVLQYEALRDMGDTTCEMQDFAAARDYYEQARTVFKNKLTPERHRELLKCLKDVSLKERDFPCAYRELKELLTLSTDQTYIEVLLELGQVADQLGDTVSSDSYFAHCLFLAGFNALKPLKLWGQALSRRGEQYMACQMYRLAVSSTVHSAEALSTFLNTKEYFFLIEEHVDHEWNDVETLRQELKTMGCDDC